VLVGARTDEVERLVVQRGTLVHQTRDLHLVQSVADGAQLAAFQRGGDFVEQRVDVLSADAGEHRGDVLLGVGDEGHVDPQD